MKIPLYLRLLLLLAPLTSVAQVGSLDFTQLRVSGLGATASEAQVARRLGQPLVVVNPHYECGEYASAPGGSQFYQLRYAQAVFIGNRQQGYTLESFDFGPAGPARLTYGGQVLSAATTLGAFTRQFGLSASTPNPDNSVEVLVRRLDATASFTFRAGRLTHYEYRGTGC